jgi:hypothetical protein
MTFMVEGFLLKALHVFQVRTLQSTGFNTRVTLSNKSNEKGYLATDYRVHLTVYSPNGSSSSLHTDIALLKIDSTVRIDCTPWQIYPGEDQAMIFHLMPTRLLPSVSGDGEIDLDRSEIWSLFTAQDHYVEYYRPDGFSSGVLYQSGAFNYRKFSKEETTVIQAPKVFLTSTLDTVLSVLHTSFEPEYQRTAILRCALLDNQGSPVASWTSRIQPFTVLSVSMKKILQASGMTAFVDNATLTYTLLAFCENAALLPLIFNVDTQSGALAVEHSLPPMYYGKSVTGAIRTQMITALKSSGIFTEEEV